MSEPTNSAPEASTPDPEAAQAHDSDAAPTPEPKATANPADEPQPEPAVDEIDLEGIERDLDDVHAALSRLADGTYWTDEVTGEPISEDVLSAAPLTRRN